MACSGETNQPKPTGISHSLLLVASETNAMDSIFDHLNALYVEIHGHMARTGCQLLDWARDEGLITDDERDNYYLLGGI